MPEMTILTNMCMVYDDKGNVLVQNRRDAKWGGITFPGGHIEPKESFTDAVIREVFEETGLTIQFPQLCGVKQWYENDGTHYIVLCYKTNYYSGNLTSSDEGEVRWVRLADMHDMKLAGGMHYMLKLFLDDKISEHCFRKENGKWIDVLK